MMSANHGAGTDWAQILRSYPCDVCGAGPGQPCITYNGNAKRETHAARYYLARDSGWLFAEIDACSHCQNDPPAGHVCPNCGRHAQ